MDILFGVNGEGMGHAMRSAEMIRLLKKDYSLKVVAGGKGVSYLGEINEVSRIFNLRFFIKNGKIRHIRTFLHNLIRSPFLLYSFLALFFSCIIERPKVIVSDFEPLTAYVGLLLRIPVISFDNQHVITDTEVPEIEGRLNRAMYKIIVYLMCPFPKKKVITSFFFPRKLTKNCIFVPPVIRKIILDVKGVRKKKVLVYFSFENDGALDMLEKLRIKCAFYGKTKKKESRFLKIKKFDVKGFAKDLAECKAVVSSAGMTTLGEAFYLNKPVLCFPLKGQTEQEINAHYVNKRRFGKSAESEKDIKDFFSNLGVYGGNLSKFKFSNEDAYLELKRAIDFYLKNSTNLVCCLC